MARPETIEDILDVYSAKPARLVDINTTELLQHGNVGVVYAAFALMDAAEKAGYQINRDGEWVIKRELSIAELEKVLAQEQRDWDVRQRTYEEAVRNPLAFAEKKDYMRWSVDRHAKESGLDPVEWPATDEE